MDTIYLIDYENVREHGLTAIQPLDEEDSVYLLYTNNASKIGLDALANIDATMRFMKVVAGKQSLDMHLVSYLGYLLRKNGKSKKYVIVSRDGGFDGVVRFWKNKGYNVMRDSVPQMSAKSETRNTTRRPARGSKRSDFMQVDDAAEETEADDLNEMTSAPLPEENDGALASADVLPEEKTEAGFEEQTEPEMNLAGRPETEAKPDGTETTEDATEKPAPKTNNRRTGTRGGRRRSGTGRQTADHKGQAGAKQADAKREDEMPADATQEEERGADLKPAERRQSDSRQSSDAQEKEASAAETINPRLALNNMVLALYGKAKVDAEDAGFIASQVVKNSDVKNGKAIVYREIVKKFGQKKGLEYYNVIKKEI